MEMKPIKTKTAYEEALSILVEAYEDEHHPFDPPDPIEAIKFRLEQQGVTTTRRNDDSA